MNNSCPVCGGLETEVRDVYRGQHAAFSDLHRRHCSLCGLDFASPMPSASALEQYNASYFEAAHGGVALDSVTQAFFVGIAKLRMAHVQKYLDINNISVSTVMEYGPGPGYFAQCWKQRYPETKYFAYETDSSCHSSLINKGVLLRGRAEADQRPLNADLIVMSHVLEHVSHPLDFLESASRDLRLGGGLFVEVPCMDYIHKNMDEPHVLFFDKNSMHRLLEKSGFDQIELGYFGKPLAKAKRAVGVHRYWEWLRARLIGVGVTLPFSMMGGSVGSSLSLREQAVLAPYLAHLESSKPAWWLRGMARKER